MLHFAKMFEYGGDISVFHGAFMSSVGKAQEFLKVNKNEEQFSWENIYMNLKKEHCTKISYIIAQAFREGSSDLESNLSSDYLNCRVHASAFNAAMSFGKPNDTEGYFESLDGVLPNISWTLYFELLKAFQWNQYFTECVAALPPDVARKLVESAIMHFEEDPLDNDTFLLDCCSEIIFKHSYSYVHRYVLCKDQNGNNEDEVSQEVGPTSVCLMATRNAQCMHTLWSSVYADDERGASNIIKLSINTLLALFNCIKRSKYEKFTSDFMELSCNKMTILNDKELCELCERQKEEIIKEEIIMLMKCTIDLVKGACEILASDRGKAFFADMCKELGNIPSREKTLFDLLFIQFIGFLKEFMIICSSMMFRKDFQTIISSFSEITAILDECELGKSIWFSKVHSLLLWSTDISLDKYHVMMDDIMGNSSSISEESVLELFEKNTDLLCKPTCIDMLTDIILSNQVLQKERMIRIFLDAFKTLKAEEQEGYLHEFIKSHGTTEIFKTSDFNTQVVHFLNQIVEAETFASRIQGQVFTLCLQSPCDFIRQIIKQGIKNCGGVSALAQILRIISFICNYKEDCHSPSLLVKCFCHIIEKEELSEQQKENLIILVQALLQYKNENSYEVLSSEDLLIWCILPHLQVNLDRSLLDVSIDILQIVSTEVNFWSENIRKVAVIWCLYQVLEHYTIERNGGKRQVIIATINLLMSQGISYTEKDIKWLEACVKDVNPVWYLWLEYRFFNKSIEKEQLEEIPLVDVLFGCSFGLTKEMSSAAVQAKLNEINDDLRYPYLVVSLSKVLLHGTSEEWIFCFDTVSTSIEELHISPVITSFTEGIKVSNKKFMKAFHIFVDALLLVHSTDLPNIQWHYMISCFNKVVKHAVNEAESDRMFVGFMSCEICRLATVLDTVYATDIAAALLDIASFWKDSYSTEGHLTAVLLNALDTISSIDGVENLRKILN